MSNKLRLQTCRNITMLIRAAKNARIADVYWRQFNRMAQRFNNTENPSG